MNKEQFRKELEDCWAAAICWQVSEYKQELDVANNPMKPQPTREQWITTRLAALDDGNDERRAVKEFSLVLYRLMKSFNDIQRNEQQEKRWKEAEYIQQKNFSVNDILRVDDGQDGKGLDGLIEWCEKQKGENMDSDISPDDDLFDVKATENMIWSLVINKLKETALPVADGEGESPAPEKLETPNDLIKSLNWCKNLLSSITAAAIAGRNLDFVKHGTPFFEEMLMAHQSAKAVLAKSLTSAVTGGVKEDAVGFAEWLTTMRVDRIGGGFWEVDGLEKIADDGKTGIAPVMSTERLYQLFKSGYKSEGQPE